jgi:hypothetical protein
MTAALPLNTTEPACTGADDGLLAQPATTAARIITASALAAIPRKPCAGFLPKKIAFFILPS